MKNIIHYVLILDQSGSMAQLKKEVIRSFNEQVEMILKLIRNEPESEIRLTLCVFNGTIEFKFSEQSIDQIKRLTSKNYQPDSLSALYDAIGTSFLKISELVKPDDQVFFAIFTDGLENASKFYSAEDITYKINAGEKSGWKIRFFCRYEDHKFYKKQLGIPVTTMFSMGMNSLGFEEMESEIHFCLSEMLDKKGEKS